MKFKKLRGAWDTLTSKGARALFDQPCTPVFGSLCGKTTASGGMEVIMAPPGEDTACD
jgi:hypothetical protein